MKKMITREAVEAAIQQLTANGHKITLRSVQEHLGGGSMTTISNIFKEIKEDTGQNAADLFVDIPEPLLDSIKTIWSKAKEHARLSFKEAEDSFESDMAAMQAQLKTHEAAVSDAQDALRHESQALERSNDLIDEQQARIKDKEQQLTEIKRALEDQKRNHEVVLEKLDAQLNVAKDKTESLTAKIAEDGEQYKRDITAMSMKVDEARSEAARYKTEVDNLRGHLNTLKEDHSAVILDMEKSRLAAKGLETENASIRSEKDSLAAQVFSLDEARKEQLVWLDQAKSDNNTLSGEVIALKSKNEALESQVASLTQAALQSNDIKNQLAELRNAVHGKNKKQ